MKDAKRIVVFCAAESHPLWELAYTKGWPTPGVIGEHWSPEKEETVGGSKRIARRDGGFDFVDPSGRPLRNWERTSRRSPERNQAIRQRWEQAGKLDENGVRKPWKVYDLGRQYVLRCPECGDSVRRSDERLQKQFDLLFEAGMLRISLSGLRVLPRD